jgi:adenine nucleotide transporter 17
LLSSDSVIKSRLQAGSANASKYKSSFDGLLIILREEGVEGLYKGIGSKLLQSVLTAAILFAGQRRLFELTKKVNILHENSRGQLF